VDIQSTFPLTDPPVAVPWGISEVELQELLGPHLRHVTKGYYTKTSTSFPRLTHELGFHFEPRVGGRLVELEFFRRSYADPNASFSEFQAAFEAHFGTPLRSHPGEGGFPSCEWVVGSVSISHFILERFGPEEYMRVRRIGA
jgi:hypothetical protein